MSDGRDDIIFDEPEEEEEPTQCKFAELWCRASIQGPEEWLECDNDAEDGRDYCRVHRNCEVTREDYLADLGRDL